MPLPVGEIIIPKHQCERFPVLFITERKSHFFGLEVENNKRGGIPQWTRVGKNLFIADGNVDKVTVDLDAKLSGAPFILATKFYQNVIGFANSECFFPEVVYASRVWDLGWNIPQLVVVVDTHPWRSAREPSMFRRVPLVVVVVAALGKYHECSKYATKPSTCIGTRAWSLALRWKSSRTSVMSTFLPPASFFRCSKILHGCNMPTSVHLAGPALCSQQLWCSLVLIILRCDIFILFYPPRSRKIFQAEFLALRYISRTTESYFQHGQHYRRQRTPLVRIIPEAWHRPRMIMILNKYTKGVAERENYISRRFVI